MLCTVRVSELLFTNNFCYKWSVFSCQFFCPAIDITISGWKDIIHGVPRRSVCEPLIFNIHINGQIMPVTGNTTPNEERNNMKVRE